MAAGDGTTHHGDNVSRTNRLADPQSGLSPLRHTALAAAAAIALLHAGPSQAFEVDTGNPDLSVRWDNTVRFNYAVRVEQRDPKIGNSAVSDEGTYSFDRGDAVAKRLDLLSEFDLIWRKRYGARVSAAAWADGAYGGESRSNPNAPLVNIPSYVNHEYSSTIERLYRGPSGEFLDAFAFGEFDVANVPVRVKLGRHTVYWGESLLLGGNLHSVAYAQNPLDLQKGFATPGAEAKELFRPLNQLSMQAQLSDTLSLAGQYLLEWEPFRYPEGGTYLGPVDFAFNGPDRQFLSTTLGFAARGDAVEPHQSGEFGLAARWSPQWLDGTMGFYYRRFSDKLPQTLLTAVAPNASRYNMVYADGIDLFGVSLAKNIAGVSVGAEVSYRRNTPLSAQVLGVAPGLPDAGDTKGPRGDTWHALVNGLGTIAQNAAVRQRRLERGAHLVALVEAAQRREPVQRDRLRTMPGKRHPPEGSRQVGRMRDEELRGHRCGLHAELVPGLAGRRSVDAADLRGRAVRQCRHRVRRQRGPGQLLDRAVRRRAAEVPLRPQVHRLRGPVSRQRNRGDDPERIHDLPEGSRFREPHLQDHVLKAGDER